MMKQIFFLHGLPRAGNTLLSSILNQNPNVALTANSVCPEMLGMLNLVKGSGEFVNFPDHNSFDNVTKSLFENYIKANNLTFADLIKFDPSEFTWYGEWLLHSKEIRLMPREEIFKNYHYKHQYEEDQKAGYTFEHLSRYYLGVCIQSNWNK